MNFHIYNYNIFIEKNNIVIIEISQNENLLATIFWGVNY